MRQMRQVFLEREFAVRMDRVLQSQLLADIAHHSDYLIEALSGVPEGAFSTGLGTTSPYQPLLSVRQSDKSLASTSFPGCAPVGFSPQ